MIEFIGEIYFLVFMKELEEVSGFVKNIGCFDVLDFCFNFGVMLIFVIFFFVFGFVVFIN